MEQIIIEEERKFPEDLIPVTEMLTFLPEDPNARMGFVMGLLFTLYLM